MSVRFKTAQKRLLSVIVAVGGADALTKTWAERRLTDPVDLVAGARLELSHNTGVAFGGFAGAPPWLVTTTVVACVLGVVVVWVRGAIVAGPASGGLVLGGALANLADRLEGGGVTDFIDVGGWPSFNVADAALSVGMAVLVLSNLRTSPRLGGTSSFSRPRS